MKEKRKESLRRPSEVSVKQDTEKKKATELLSQVKYDPQCKCWVGPVTGKTGTLQRTKMVSEREWRMKQQDADNLDHNRKKVERTKTPNLEEDDDGTTIKEDFNINESKIEPPFTCLLDGERTAKWGPVAMTKDRGPINITFEKPSKSDQSFLLSSAEKVKQLEAQLEKKDQDIALLRKELEHAHKETDKLVEKLKGYTGKQYEEIAAENAQLKEACKRLTRKNVILEGEKKKENNSKIHQMEQEKLLEEQHHSDWSKSGHNSQNKDPENLVIKIDRKEK